MFCCFVVVVGCAGACAFGPLSFSHYHYFTGIILYSLWHKKRRKLLFNSFKKFSATRYAWGENYRVSPQSWLWNPGFTDQEYLWNIFLKSWLGWFDQEGKLNPFSPSLTFHKSFRSETTRFYIRDGSITFQRVNIVEFFTIFLFSILEINIILQLFDFSFVSLIMIPTLSIKTVKLECFLFRQEITIFWSFQLQCEVTIKCFVNGVFLVSARNN